MNDKTILIFGAGNIGRSFVGQIFSRAGYKVTFADVDPVLVARLNATGSYTVVFKHPDGREEPVPVGPVAAIDARDRTLVAQHVAGADVIATAVGARAFPRLFPTIAAGIPLRRAPVDIIIAENMPCAADVMRSGLEAELPSPDLLDGVGLVETSVGKMVPLVRSRDVDEDPPVLFAEPYNTLIVDRAAFRNPIPPVPDLLPVAPIQAYVDRKLFIHNLGHAAAAYFGYLTCPECTFLWEVLEHPTVLEEARRAMMQSARALAKEYPRTFDDTVLTAHIEDLLERFRNRALGDTVYRVGRDLPRKLGPGERLLGAFDLAMKHRIEAPTLAAVIEAALQFRKPDESGELFPADSAFHSALHTVANLRERGVLLK